jgi:hypothetical protein
MRWTLSVERMTTDERTAAYMKLLRIGCVVQRYHSYNGELFAVDLTVGNMQQMIALHNIVLHSAAYVVTPAGETSFADDSFA